MIIEANFLCARKASARNAVGLGYREEVVPEKRLQRASTTCDLIYALCLPILKSQKAAGSIDFAPG